MGELKEYIKTLQTRIFNQRTELANLRRKLEQVTDELDAWRESLEDFKNAIKGIVWFDIALDNEETQYLTQRIEETYEEYI